MRVRKTTVEEYEAFYFTADKVTGWVYRGPAQRLLRDPVKCVERRPGESIEMCYKRAAEKYPVSGLFKYYQPPNSGRVILKPKHRKYYIEKEDGFEGLSRTELKAAGYELLEE